MSVKADEQRCLRSLAFRLRQLASGMPINGHRALYLLAADALEKHSHWLAGQEQPTPARDPALYEPVDLSV